MKLQGLVLVAGAMLPTTAEAGVAVKVTDPKTAAFELEVDGVGWLNSADTRFFANGKWHSASDGSLVLEKSTTSDGEDMHGKFSELAFEWSASSTPVLTSIRVYNDEDTFVVFEQSYPEGANGTSTGDREDVNSQFPSFKIEDSPDASNPRGYLSFAGCMIGDGHAGEQFFVCCNSSFSS